MKITRGNRHRSVLLGALGAFALSAALVPTAGQAKPAAPQRASFHGCRVDCGVIDAAPIEGAEATLHRSDGGLTAQVVSRGLVPGNVHTVWFIVFNAPEYCVSNRSGPMRCGMAEVFEPVAEPAHIWGAGFKAPASGSVRVTARIKTGDLTHVAFDHENGLTDPFGAEVALIIRDHGVPLSNPDQATTMNGGCKMAVLMPGTGSWGTNDCENKQAAMFPATA